MPGRTRKFTLKDLSVEIPKIFDQVQNSTANHQKNYVALFKLHSEAAQVTEPRDRGMALKPIGERAFEDILMHMVARILSVKKGVVPADRIAKFLGGYTKFINEKGESANDATFLSLPTIIPIAAEEAFKRRQAAVPDNDDDETTAARYTAALLRYLLKGCAVKDKTVRHRALQVISEMISHLGEVEYVPCDRDYRPTLTSVSQRRHLPINAYCSHWPRL
jgi:condensin complex subunit 3